MYQIVYIVFIVNNLECTLKEKMADIESITIQSVCGTYQVVGKCIPSRWTGIRVGKTHLVYVDILIYGTCN